MSDALTPLRHVYGVEPVGPPPARGDDAFAEFEAARQMGEVLDALSLGPPRAAVLDAVHARAAEPSTSVTVADAGLAPLATALGLASTAPADPVETAVLTQTADALGRLRRPRPSADALAAVLRAAAEASDEGLAPIRQVYEGVEAAPSVEADLLRQSRVVVERALASRPQPRPARATTDAVLAAAAHASVRDEAEVTVPALAPLALALGLPTSHGADPAETALLAQTSDALGRLPRHRPAAAVTAAIAAQAAAASRPQVRAADRPAARPTRARRPVGVWAGAAGLVLMAVFAVVVLPQFAPSDVAPQLAAADLAPEPEAAVEPVPEPPATEESSVAPTSPVEAVTLAPAGPSPAATPAPTRSRFVQAAPRPASAPSTPTITLASADRAPERAAAVAAPEAAPMGSAWDADDDLRTLALRLETLGQTAEGLEWDEPAEPFGAPVRTALTSTNGIQAVRAGAPARVVVRPDSTSPRR